MCDLLFSISHFALLIWAPLGVYLGWQQFAHWGAADWAFVGASGLSHVLCFLVLLRGCRQEPLIVVYPLAGGSGPLVSSMVAIALFWE